MIDYNDKMYKSCLNFAEFSSNQVLNLSNIAIFISVSPQNGKTGAIPQDGIVRISFDGSNEKEKNRNWNFPKNLTTEMQSSLPVLARHKF